MPVAIRSHTVEVSRASIPVWIWIREDCGCVQVGGLLQAVQAEGGLPLLDMAGQKFWNTGLTMSNLHR